MLGLPRDQRLGKTRAIEQEIGLEILCGIVGDSLNISRHAVDHAVGEPR